VPSYNSECTTIAVWILAARSAALASCAAKVGPPASLEWLSERVEMFRRIFEPLVRELELR